jgi:phospholipid/cholesterol/gamma-HCH transport system substrate-binding protein
MKATNTRRATIVGIFIFIGLAIFILTVLTLGNQQKTFQKSLTVNAVFDDVNGLQKGNNVWFSGVKIGTIKKVSLAGNEKVKVTLGIEEKSKQFIRKDAKAKVSSDGLIGNKIIVIYGGTLQAPEIQQGDILGVEKLKTTEEMMNTLQQSNDNLLDITTGFRTISNDLVAGKGTVGKLLSDDRLMNSIYATTNSLQRASNKIEQLSNSMSNYAGKLQTKGSLANELVTDTVLFRQLKSTAEQLQSASAKSNEVIDDLKQASNSVNQSMTNPKAPLGMLLNDEQAAGYLKTTLNNLQSGTKKLDENMEALQHNFLFRRFFKKKAKEEKEQIILPQPDTVIYK